jgi:hypothetical protein
LTDEEAVEKARQRGEELFGNRSAEYGDLPIESFRIVESADTVTGAKIYNDFVKGISSNPEVYTRDNLLFGALQ